MNRVVLVASFVSLVSLVACQKASPAPVVLEAAPPSSAPPVVMAEAGPAPSARAEDRDAPYRCAADADCLTTCKLGALGRTWWRAHENEYDDWTCHDGCASKGMSAVCKAGSCAAVDTRYGKSAPADDCTRRPLPKADPDGPFRCSADADCALSCSLGAVGTRWYRAHASRINECDDGCAGPGEQARCKDGLCAAFDERHPGAPRLDEGCTRRKLELTR